MWVSTHSRPKAAGQPESDGKRQLKFQHTAARRRLAIVLFGIVTVLLFQHTAARRRLEVFCNAVFGFDRFQHTAARRRLARTPLTPINSKRFQHTAARRRLDPHRQIPRGGDGFNTQPPEGGWLEKTKKKGSVKVSTHSRPKAAGFACSACHDAIDVSTHSRPKAAGLLF